ncbi:APC family permease [Nodosilinea nodulosa]|uniref:APC family permease n=1 Tax=Nodosilinea nodulosa TaxID=416001 RepID=UPI0003116122|nr:APC family permease [Nodosilinea nodulosa]
MPTLDVSRDSPALRRNTLRLPQLIVMAVAAMAPVGCILFNTIPQAGLVGAAMPLCYVIGFGVILLIAPQIGEMAMEFPASGSCYTFVAQGLGASWGFMAGWLGLVFYGISIPFIIVLVSTNIQDLVQRLGLQIDWTLWYVLVTVIVGRICYRGALFSLQTDFVFLIFELGVCLVLAFVVLLQLGQAGQLTLTPLTLGGLPQHSNPFLGTILAILGFLGFESVTTLSEEAKKPRQTIPQAMFVALMLVGAFYLLMSYVAVLGYGIENMTAFAQDAAPFDAIARRFLGNGFALLIDLAAIMAGYAGTVAFTNGAARLLYAISREGLLPEWLSRIHPVHHTPANAILGLQAMALVIGLGLGHVWTPIQAIGFFGTLLTLAVLLIYALVSLACFRYFKVKRPDRWHGFRHGLLPACSVLAIGVVIAGTLYPLPPVPHRFAPVAIGIWLLVGVGILRFLQVYRPKELRQAGRQFLANGTEANY